jgi:hypothetical protein
MRLPNDPSQKGIVDPKMFPADPEVARRARETTAALEAELETVDGWKERRRLRKGIRRAKREAATGVERSHRGAIY